MHVVVSFIRNIKDFVHKLVTKLSALLLFRLLLVSFKLGSALAHVAHFTTACLLHLDNKTLLLLDAEVNVVLAASLVLSFPKCAVLNNNIFALGGAPCLVVKLFLLAGLALHKVSHMLVSCFAFQVRVKLVLSVYQTATALLALVTLAVSYGFLCSVLEAS